MVAIARECKEGHGKNDITAYIDRIDAIVARNLSIGGLTISTNY